MNKIWTDRRLFIALVGIISLTWLGISKSLDVSLAIAGIVASVSAANAYQKKE